MSGRWVYLPKPPHECNPPTSISVNRWPFTAGTSIPLGAVWECGCGQRWERVEGHAFIGPTRWVQVDT